jgi:hypothetical protein
MVAFEQATENGFIFEVEMEDHTSHNGGKDEMEVA